MSERPPRPDGLETDRYLLAALRHAPDAEQSAPAALGAAILRKAQAAVAARVPATPRRAAPRRAVAGWDHLAAFWRALARPPVAAGLASLMLATTLGLWWSDGRLDDPFPDRASPPAAATPDAAANTAPDAAPPAPRTAPAAAAEALSLPEASRPAMPSPVLPAAAPPPAPSVALALPPSPHAPKAERRETPEAPQPRAPDDTRQAKSTASEATPAAATSAVEATPPTAAMAAAEAPPPVAVAPAPQALPQSLGAAPGTVNEPAAPVPRSVSGAAQARARAPSTPALAAAAAPTPEVEASASIGGEPSPSTSRLAQQLRAAPAAWRWLRGTAAAAALPSALPGWLDQVASEAAAAGIGWRRLVAAPPPPQAGRDTVGSLRGPEGRLHRFVIGAEGLHWERPDGGAWLLALPPPALQRLADALP